jgi:hypothetical protein
MVAFRKLRNPSNRTNPKKSISRQVITKLLKINREKEVLQAAKENSVLLTGEFIT